MQHHALQCSVILRITRKFRRELTQEDEVVNVVVERARRFVGVARETHSDDPLRLVRQRRSECTNKYNHVHVHAGHLLVVQFIYSLVVGGALCVGMHMSQLDVWIVLQTQQQVAQLRADRSDPDVSKCT